MNEPMETKTRLTLDVSETICQATVSITRGDTARLVVISLMENGEPYVLPSPVSVFFTAERTIDGQELPICDPCSVDHVHGFILYRVPLQTTSFEGCFEGQFEIVDADGTMLPLPRMAIAIRENLLPDAVVEADSFDALRDLVAEFTRDKNAVMEDSSAIHEAFGGGEAGQVLRKRSDDDLDVEWADVTFPPSPLPTGTVATVAGEYAEALAFASDPQEQLDALRARMDDLLYEEIDIRSFAVSPSVAEQGSTVSILTLSWTLNKEAAEVRVDGTVVTDASGTSGSVVLGDRSITASETHMLSVTDERGRVVSRSAGISFLNGVYWGAASDPGAPDSAFVRALSTRVLTASRGRTFTVTAGAGEFIWYCLPVRLGECTFKVGGFEGGFELVSIMDFTNASGYTEQYRVYRSANDGLGNTSVEVK